MATTSQSDVMKSFLVELGFKIDEAGFKKFKSGIGQSTKDAMTLGGAVIGVGMAVEKFVEGIAEDMSKLYLTSERTNTSVSNLMQVQSAFLAIGESSEQANAAVSKLGAVLRDFGGEARFEMIAKGLGMQVTTKPGGKEMRDTGELFDEFLDKLLPFIPKKGEKPRPESVMAFQFLEQNLGLKPDDIALMKAERDHMKEMAEYRKDANDAAGNTADVLQDQSKQSLEFVRDLGKLGIAIGAIATQLARISMPTVDAVIRFLTKIAELMGRANNGEQNEASLFPADASEGLMHYWARDLAALATGNKLAPYQKGGDWFSNKSPEITSAPSGATSTEPTEKHAPYIINEKNAGDADEAAFYAKYGNAGAAGAESMGRSGTIQYSSNYAYDPDFIAGQGKYNYSNLANIAGSITNARMGAATPPGAAASSGTVDNRQQHIAPVTNINLNGPTTPDAVASVKSLVRRSNEDLQRMGLSILSTPTY